MFNLRILRMPDSTRFSSMYHPTMMTIVTRAAGDEGNILCTSESKQFKTCAGIPRTQGTALRQKRTQSGRTWVLQCVSLLASFWPFGFCSHKQFLLAVFPGLCHHTGLPSVCLRRGQSEGKTCFSFVTRPTSHSTASSQHSSVHRIHIVWFRGAQKSQRISQSRRNQPNRED